MIPPKRKHEEDNVDSWLMSYADMITLLLAFFVIFVSISEPKSEKMQAIKESVSGQFGTIDLATPFQGTFKTLQEVVEEKQLLKDISVERTENGIRMEFSRGAFFLPGTTDFAPDKEEALKEMIKAIKAIDYLDFRVTIEGHSSDMPPISLYPSNWEYTTAQASRMARFFIEQGIAANHVKVAGYADTQPKVPNKDLEGRPIVENRLRNERIEIAIERKL